MSEFRCGNRLGRAFHVVMATLAVALAFVLLLVGARFLRPPQVPETVVGPDRVELLREWPLYPVCDRPIAFSIPEREVSQILERIEPLPSGMTASLCLHLLVARGFEASFQDGRVASSDEVLKLFLDDELGRAYFGSPAVVRTRYGIRPSMYGEAGASKEGHYDQTLGTMAQLGLPLSLPVRVGGEMFTLREMLRDSLACFEPGQRELEWTAIAYASYLPPHRAWLNKFGEQFSFDQLAIGLLDRKLSEASCSGCHVVDAIILLLRADDGEARILSPSTRQRLQERRDELVQAALSTQDTDGSWGRDWYAGVAGATRPDRLSPESRTIASRLAATSHIVDWMLHLPEGARAPPDVLSRAVDWIYLRLKEAPPEFIRENYCASSHGGWVLRVVADGSGGSGDYRRARYTREPAEKILTSRGR